MSPFLPSLAGATSVSNDRLSGLAQSVQLGSEDDLVLIEGGRVAHAPRAKLSRVLKDAQLRYLQPRYEQVALAHVHGYRPQRGIVSNARVHLGADIVLSIDVRKFFQSISRDRVERALSTLNTTPTDRDLLLDLAFVGTSLPLGFQTSPVLANIAFHSTDELLAEFASSRRLALSRYADDLSFSGPGVGDSTLAEVGDLLSEQGWTLNTRKTRFLRTGRRQYVTGVYVGDESLRAPRAFKRSISAHIQAVRTMGWDEFFDRPQNPTPLALFSRIGYVTSIERATGAKFRKQLTALAPPDSEAVDAFDPGDDADKP